MMIGGMSVVSRVWIGIGIGIKVVRRELLM